MSMMGRQTFSRLTKPPCPTLLKAESSLCLIKILMQHSTLWSIALLASLLSSQFPVSVSRSKNDPSPILKSPNVIESFNGRCPCLFNSVASAFVPVYAVTSFLKAPMVSDEEHMISYLAQSRLLTNTFINFPAATLFLCETFSSVTSSLPSLFFLGEVLLFIVFVVHLFCIRDLLTASALSNDLWLRRRVVFGFGRFFNVDMGVCFPRGGGKCDFM